MKKKALIVSIKPQYASRILNGDKKIELRKSSPNVTTDDIVVIYATAPVKAIVGYCKVKEIVKDRPSNLWRTYGEIAGINKKDFNSYYNETSFGVGILLKDVRALKRNFELDNLRKYFPFFNPPQSYAYLNMSEIYSTLKNRLKAA